MIRVLGRGQARSSGQHQVQFLRHPVGTRTLATTLRRCTTKVVTRLLAWMGWGVVAQSLGHRSLRLDENGCCAPWEALAPLPATWKPGISRDAVNLRLGAKCSSYCSFHRSAGMTPCRPLSVVCSSNKMLGRFTALVLVLAASTPDALAIGRSLQQSTGNSVPVSATLADLINDPQGQGHLLVPPPCLCFISAH